MSEFKTNKISPRKGTTTTIGDSGDTIATSSGTTLDIQGTYSGINAISWDTTAKTSDFTAETNRGYFIDTSSGGVIITLPATPVAGSFIGIKDYALTAQTNNISIAPNGNKIQGTTDTYLITTQGGSANLVYVDSTQGWLTFDAAQASDIAENQLFVTATGGTITTCGNFKIHTFTGPGTFCVSCGGNAAGSTTVDYLVVAGGAGSGGNGNGGSGAGGAGGFRESSGAASGCYTTSPLGACVSALPVTVQGYPISVGAGGAGGVEGNPGVPGSNSIFSTITSAGGGGGGPAFLPTGVSGSAGGSGGGGSYKGGGSGAGNTPSTSPPQGNNGGSGTPSPTTGGGSGGGGGATGTGSPNPGPFNGGPGGAGATTSISASPTAYAGGGGGAGKCGGGSGGLGGGGNGGGCNGAGRQNGTTNTGGGGGGGERSGATSGGSGIVIIRYKYQ